MKSKLKFLTMALLFAAPLVAAWQLFFVHPEWQPEGHTNYGTLVSPVRAIPVLDWRDGAGAAAEFPSGKWTLIYLGGASCDEACSQRLLLSRQVRLALDRNRERVRRVYLAPDAAALTAAREQLAAAHTDLVFLAAPDSGARDFFQAADPNALYLLDPMGNWLMTYAGEVEPKGMHKDLKKLLRFSQAG